MKKQFLIGKHNLKKIERFIVIVLFLSNMIFVIKYLQTNSYNKYLQEKIISFENVKFSPVVVAKSDTLNVGEEYMAQVFLAYANQNDLPVVAIENECNEESFSQNYYRDTLNYNLFYNSFIYTFLPKYKGEHTWCGVINNKHFGKFEQFYFEVDYFVK